MDAVRVPGDIEVDCAVWFVVVVGTLLNTDPPNAPGVGCWGGWVPILVVAGLANRLLVPPNKLLVGCTVVCGVPNRPVCC